MKKKFFVIFGFVVFVFGLFVLFFIFFYWVNIDNLEVIKWVFLFMLVNVLKGDVIKNKVLFEK